MAKAMRIALCGMHEEENTFAFEMMGLATVTGNMSTGFQRRHAFVAYFQKDPKTNDDAKHRACPSLAGETTWQRS